MSSDKTPILSIRSISKTFPGQMALDRAKLDLFGGTVHALLGQNGCGKSTLIKILDGLYTADEGSEVELDNRPIDLSTLGPEHRSRVRVVHQDLGLVDSLSVTENLALGNGFGTRMFGRIAWRRERQHAQTLLRQFSVGIDPRALLRDLAPAERTLIGILRGIQDWNPAHGILILDEPTASLPRPEVKRLFELVREIASRGAVILFVSHRLDEVFEIADTITVLRDGSTALSEQTTRLTHDEVVEAIIGQKLDTATARPASGGESEPILSVTRLWGQIVENFDLDVRPGEIVGVAGLTGSGREELASLLAGSGRRAFGDIRVRGRSIGAGSHNARTAGIGYVPAERAKYAALRERSVSANLVLGATNGHRWWLTRAAEDGQTRTWISRLNVRPSNPQQLFTTLSGGNQQKVVIGRALRQNPLALICDEPTQGVDVGAKDRIHALLSEAASDGAGVVVCSSDADELAAICNRVVIIRDGGAIAQLRSSDLSPESITEAALA